MGQGLWKRKKFVTSPEEKTTKNILFLQLFLQIQMKGGKKKRKPFHPTPGQACSEETTLSNNTRGNMMPLRDLAIPVFTQCLFLGSDSQVTMVMFICLCLFLH